MVSEATDLVAVRTALQAAGVDYDSAEASFVPSMQVELDQDGAGKVFRLVEALEDLDDVQNVFANFDVSDDVLEARRLTPEAQVAWPTPTSPTRAQPGRLTRAGAGASYPPGAAVSVVRTGVRTTEE